MSEHKNHGGHHKGHADDHLAKRKKTATALKYRDHMKAPQVVANGKGAVADLIIQLARENGIPVEVDPDLAEVLSTLDYYEYIPPELYYAVAQILNKLYDVNQLVGSLSEEEREGKERDGRRYAKKGEASVAMPLNVSGSDANLIGLNGMDTTGDRVQDSNNAYRSGAVKFGRRNVMPAGAGKPSNSSSSSKASSTTSTTSSTEANAKPNAQQNTQSAQPAQQKRQMPNNNVQSNKVQIATTADNMPVDLNAITTKGVSNNQNSQPQQPQQPPQVFHVTQTVNGPLGANNQQELNPEQPEHNPNIIRSAGSGTKKRANQAQARPKNLKFDTDQILEQFNKRKR